MVKEEAGDWKDVKGKEETQKEQACSAALGGRKEAGDGDSSLRTAFRGSYMIHGCSQISVPCCV